MAEVEDEQSAPDGAIACGLAVVHPWLCDGMGHLTTRHYLAMFDDASYHLFAALGYDSLAAEWQGIGWADVRHEIEYKGELQSGALVTIDGKVTMLGNSSLSTSFRLYQLGETRPRATLAGRTVCFDLEARRSRPLPEFFVERARARFTLL